MAGERRVQKDGRLCSFAAALATFWERWPGTLEEEFQDYQKHTSEAHGLGDEHGLARWYGLAAFVVQVDYDAAGAVNVKARDAMTDAAKAAGFKNVDTAGSRAAFEFAPG